ncbi:MAG: hypothetical protein AAGM38_15905 [Pseudomonadota bacterium]
MNHAPLTETEYQALSAVPGLDALISDATKHQALVRAIAQIRAEAAGVERKLLFATIAQVRSGADVPAEAKEAFANVQEMLVYLGSSDPLAAPGANAASPPIKALIDQAIRRRD